MIRFFAEDCANEKSHHVIIELQNIKKLPKKLDIELLL